MVLLPKLLRTHCCGRVSTSVLCLLTDGFEEIEAVTPIDLLRRAGIKVVIAAIGDSLSITGRSGIIIQADVILNETHKPCFFDLLLIPGGPAIAALREDGRATALAVDFHDAGKPIAAICAAPLILKDAGLLIGRRFTAHATTREELPDALDARVIKDGPVITSRGAATSMDFSLAIIANLIGDDAAKQVADAIMA